MMKISTSLVVGLSLIAFAGCKKKKDDGAAPKTTEGSAAVKGSAAEGSAAVATPPPPKAEPVPPQQISTQYQVCIGHVNAAKWDEFGKECIDDNFNVHAVAGMPEAKGKDALLTWFKDQKTAFPDWKLAPQIVLINGQNLLAISLSTGTHTGPMKTPMGDVPATKKKTGLLMFHRLKITDAGKASDEWPFMDPSTLMGQLGQAPKGAPPTRAAMDKGLQGAPDIAITKFTADEATEKANLELVKKGNDAFNAKKIPDMLAMLTDDAVESDQAGPKDYKGKKEIEKGIQEFTAAFSDAKLTNIEMWAAGNYVAQIGKFEGTNDGDLGKMKKTGKKVSLDFAEVVKITDGKISHVWRFHSGMDFAMQLGLMPPPGAAPAGGAPAGDMKDHKDHKGHDMKKEPAKKM